MATVKIKFRPSSVDGREGTVYYQVIHGRVARQINTSCKLFPAEWSKRHSRIVIASSDEDRRQYLLLLDKKIAEDTDRLENVCDKAPHLRLKVRWFHHGRMQGFQF